uniref:Uncharacterized protein n=1 Tax=Trieres chinensis TaxID=1514140 RepID=A0A7S2A5V0_TRICV|mmetsp:Transcript_4289/g.9054  ORF Transcript_4289/g.9054 Transcript_4289/m.9054 type:complete len:181 (+) Transcript_4289:251-793(+)|eukprot:CAMPEP_0183306714 /NCGR_PEP_ID=MMETSP0160_2-20130417/13546_1 /TAXON_ID=2839 ORGANISM="Odontella Sinensis, Strain Grunow 1884" /NCGR_SAMPLE_ID=MMETSP0160_2 /ASSEMBLY_ACC=CAM_ASM_000250 /LENGTH=180 /DNA_ID=CAMNT_0025470159 /DNA_START=162 /DNA_END=704 /DNA_ORIENTATION=-
MADAEKGTSWLPPDVTNSDSLESGDGLEEVNEDVAKMMDVDHMSNEEEEDYEAGGHHSLPHPEPRKAYRESHWKKYALIWGVAFTLILGVIAAFVGGYLAGEQKDSATSQSSTGGKYLPPGGEDELISDEDMSINYRRRRQMTKRRLRHNPTQSEEQAKEFHLAQVFGGQFEDRLARGFD